MRREKEGGDPPRETGRDAQHHGTDREDLHLRRGKAGSGGLSLGRGRGNRKVGSGGHSRGIENKNRGDLLLGTGLFC